MTEWETVEMRRSYLEQINRSRNAEDIAALRIVLLRFDLGEMLKKSGTDTIKSDDPAVIGLDELSQILLDYLNPNWSTDYVPHPQKR